MMRTALFSRTAWLAAGVLALAAGIGLLGPLRARMGYEDTHRQLAVILDYQQCLTLAQDEGFSLEDWLAQLQGDGFTSLAVLEDTPLWLEQRGYCTVLEGFQITKAVKEKDLLQLAREPEAKDEKPEINYAPAEKSLNEALSLSPEDLHLLFAREGTRGSLLARRIEQAAVLRLGTERVLLADRPEAGLTVVTLRGDPEELVNQGFGFVTQTARDLSTAGFWVVPRLRNQRSLPVAADVAGVVAEAHAAVPFGAPLIIGEGDETLGYPSALSETAEAFKAEGALFGLVEFAKQEGDKALAGKLVPWVVRVHSISDEEMEIYTPERALKRFLLAASERNVRAIYLKPFFLDTPGSDLRAHNTDYFQSVREGLQAMGFEITQVSDGVTTAPLTPWPVAAAVPSPSRLPGLIALACAFLLPLVALYFLTEALPRLEDRARAGDRWGMVSVAMLWLWCWGLGAALIQASLMTNAHYLLQVRSFSGVTLALLGPVILGAVLWVRVLVADPPQRIWDQAVLLGGFPVHVKHLAAGAIVLLAAVVVLMRSGNESGLGVSPIELAFRAVLGDTFGVRPRTKEFLIGHPALVLGLYLLFHPKTALRPWAYPLLVGGLLGVTSFINTFQHFHTPLDISLERTAMGMALGLVVGLLLCAAVAIALALFASRKGRKAPPEARPSEPE